MRFRVFWPLAGTTPAGAVAKSSAQRTFSS
jgi:hypothetical protein